MFDKAGDIFFDLPPSLGLEDVVRKASDAKLVYMKAEALYTQIVDRARAHKFKEEKHKFDDQTKRRKTNCFLNVPNLIKC